MKKMIVVNHMETFGRGFVAAFRRAGTRSGPVAGLILGAWLLALSIAGAADAETRVALVIGNSSYVAVETLANPVNDATDVAEALEAVGFEVLRGLDVDRQEMVTLIGRFVEAARTADVTLFYYAGHGFQIDAQNYLVPVDAVFQSGADVTRRTIGLDQLTDSLEATGGIHLIFLDACRDNPVAALLGDGAGPIRDGLARIGDAAGFLFAFSTQPDNVAYDGLGRNSYFTGSLLSHLHTTGQDIASTMIAVRNDVIAATGGRQVPWENSSLTRQFEFRPGPPAASPEVMLWQVAARVEDPALMRIYLDRYPQGAHAADVRDFLGAAAPEAAEMTDRTARALGGTEAGDAVEEQLWSLVRRLRSRDLLEVYLDQHPDGHHVEEARRLLALLPGEEVADAPGPRCERLATHPHDATASRAGVSLAKLVAQADTAIAACRAAVEARPDVPHLRALLARALHAAGRKAEAVEHYRAAADEGDLRALYSLGLMAEAGEGLPRDPAQALDYYRRAAEGGSADGAVNLAYMLAEGTVVPRDLAEARQWLERAADAGSAQATFNLGVLLTQHGTAEDYPQALEHFREAARMGESQAYFPAALLLDKGLGVDKDAKAAAELLLRGAASDHGQTIAALTNGEVTWSPATVQLVQERLAEAGFYDAAIDGASGPRLEAALRDWRRGGFL